MEEAPENGKESSNSAHANGMKWMNEFNLLNKIPQSYFINSDILTPPILCIHEKILNTNSILLWYDSVSLKNRILTFAALQCPTFPWSGKSLNITNFHPYIVLNIRVQTNLFIYSNYTVISTLPVTGLVMNRNARKLHSLCDIKTVRMENTWDTLNNIPECFDIMHKHDHEWLQCKSEKRICMNTSQVHSRQQKSIGLKFSKSQTGSDVRYRCHHNSSRFTFPIFAHSCRFSVLHSLQSITPRIY